ncbi:MAG TPA: hypothetical protein QGH10_20755, partial [Armatimonadota bacterium]|nr:hypothetical protein [Armatimonadota bacterium]
CYDVVEHIPDDPPDTTMAKWAELGRVWREIHRHARGTVTDLRGYGALEAAMQTALDGVHASAELRIVFKEQFDHAGRKRYSATGYRTKTPSPQEGIERQVDELRQLSDDGTLTPDAAGKAALAIAHAVDAALQGAALRDEEPRPDRDAFTDLDEKYQAGELDPSEAIREVGRILTDLTVDDIGWLSQAGKTTPTPPDDDNLMMCYDVSSLPAAEGGDGDG